MYWSNRHFGKFLFLYFDTFSLNKYFILPLFKSWKIILKYHYFNYVFFEKCTAVLSTLLRYYELLLQNMRVLLKIGLVCHTHCRKLQLSNNAKAYGSVKNIVSHHCKPLHQVKGWYWALSANYFIAELVLLFVKRRRDLILFPQQIREPCNFIKADLKRSSLLSNNLVWNSF